MNPPSLSDADGDKIKDDEDDDDVDGSVRDISDVLCAVGLNSKPESI